MHIARKSTPRVTRFPSLVLIRLVLTEVQWFKKNKINKEMYGVRTLCRITKAEEGLPTSDFRLRTSDFRLPTSDFRLPTSDFRLQTSDFRLPNLKHRSSTRRTQNMDRDPWTTPNFQKEIAPVNFKWKFTGDQEMKKTDSYLLLTSLRVYFLKAGCFGIVPGINGKTTSLLCHWFRRRENV